MAQEVKKVKNEETGDDEFELVLSDKDLAIFFRVFAQEAEEAMRIAAKFEEDPLTFAALSQRNREQILAQVDYDELMAAVAEVEAEAKAEAGD